MTVKTMLLFYLRISLSFRNSYVLWGHTWTEYWRHSPWSPKETGIKQAKPLCCNSWSTEWELLLLIAPLLGDNNMCFVIYPLCFSHINASDQQYILTSAFWVLMCSSCRYPIQHEETTQPLHYLPCSSPLCCTTFPCLCHHMQEAWHWAWLFPTLAMHSIVYHFIHVVWSSALLYLFLDSGFFQLSHSDSVSLNPSICLPCGLHVGWFAFFVFPMTPTTGSLL